MKVFDFCLSRLLASIKSVWFKTFMSESIVRFKKPKNQSLILKWQIRSVMEWKCSENIWRSIHNFYLHFTKVTRKCECFSRIVEPWSRPINLLTQSIVQFYSDFCQKWKRKSCNISKTGQGLLFTLMHLF